MVGGRLCACCGLPRFELPAAVKPSLFEELLQQFFMYSYEVRRYTPAAAVYSSNTPYLIVQALDVRTYTYYMYDMPCWYISWELRL